MGVAGESRAEPRAGPGREVNFELQPWTFPGGPRAHERRPPALEGRRQLQGLQRRSWQPPP